MVEFDFPRERRPVNPQRLLDRLLADRLTRPQRDPARVATIPAAEVIDRYGRLRSVGLYGGRRFPHPSSSGSDRSHPPSLDDLGIGVTL